jgi:hypothetical protein
MTNCYADQIIRAPLKFRTLAAQLHIVSEFG